jgi:hypothetical protein
MSGRAELKVLVRSAEDLAYALRDTIEVLADHERRIRLIEDRLGLKGLQHLPGEAVVAVRRAR